MTTADASQPEIVRFPGAPEVAEALATRLLSSLADLQGDSSVVQLALTGGGIATQAYERLAADGPASAVDWSRVELWWGDERFVDAADGDRNAKQALDLLAAALPLDPDRIHPMPARDAGLGLDDAAAAYAAELGATTLDICLLGMGPDGHVASLFPDHPSSSAPGDVIAVRHSPKPPPERISLTLEVINRSAEVWFVITGANKADATRLALAGGPVPAGGARGRRRTVWLLDEAAAGSAAE
jgi:6-phosphogluconolactonase